MTDEPKLHDFTKEHFQSTLDGTSLGPVRPWSPFKKIPIRLFGTNKTSHVNQEGKTSGRRAVTKGNCLDPVRGCSGGRTNQGHGCWWGCYSKESSKRFHKLFDIPISMILDEVRLVKDLSAMNEDWVRIGVNGDPCFDWPLTVEVTELVSRTQKTPVVLSRFWNTPDHRTLSSFANQGVHLHGTICAFDSRNMLDGIVGTLNEFRSMGGVGTVRLVTFAFKKDDNLWSYQNALAELGHIIEQPARVMRSNPIWPRLDQLRYRPHISYVLRKPDRRRLTAGLLYHDLPLGCATECSECHHKCGTHV